MKRLILFVCLVFLGTSIQSQSKKVLFIGNSYTGVNNLPLLIKNLALTAGDTLIYQSHTPGGARLMRHASDPEVMKKIQSEKWDYVVIQAQSQEPSWPISQVQSEVFPHAKALCDSIRAANPCAMPLFYMTWSRKNGDAINCPGWPPVCTYEGMDSLLNLRYRMMANDNNAYVSPVGAVWHYIRDNHPGIELYTSDGSHPSTAGSYVAACAFYSIIFEKDPTSIQSDYSLSANDAKAIRNAAKIIAYDSLSKWNVGAYRPKALFTFVQSGDSVYFYNNSVFADTYHWELGDGDTSTLTNPDHRYQPGTYTILLTALKCGVSDTFSQVITIRNNSVYQVSGKENQINAYPNPAKDQVTIKGITHIQNLNIYDMTGRNISSGISFQNNKINLKGLKPGIYYLIIHSDHTRDYQTTPVKIQVIP